MQDYKSLFEHIAKELDTLAERDMAKPRHLANRLSGLRWQALQLIRSALRDGLFPEFRQYVERNARIVANLEADPKMKALGQMFGDFAPLVSDKPDWSGPFSVWVTAVRNFIGQRFPERIPDNPNVPRSDLKGGLYALHYEPGLCHVETHAPGTPINPRIATRWRDEGFPENTKKVHRDSINVEASFDESDWIDRLQREAKSDAAICSVFAELASGNAVPSDEAIEETTADLARKFQCSGKRKQKRPAWERLTLHQSSDGSDHNAELDGKRIRIRGNAAFKMLDVLQKKQGQRVKAAILTLEIHQRPDRVLKLLDTRLQRIVDAPKKGGVGYAML